MCLEVGLLVLCQGGAADVDQSQQQSRAWLAWPALPRTVQRASHRLPQDNLQVTSGGRGIRTHEELAPLAVFKTAAIGH